MFNSVYSGPRTEQMAIGALFGSRDGRTLGSPPWKADLTRGMKLFAASRVRSLKNPRAIPMDAKNERGVGISVAKKNSAQSARSKFQREELEGRLEG